MAKKDQVSILIVEDENLIAMHLKMRLQQRGYNTVGPCRRVDAALECISQNRVDLAILDISLLDGEDSERVAADLSRRGIPFIFCTGLGVAGDYVTKRYPDAPKIVKPMDFKSLLRLVESVLQPALPD